ncbi:UDP-N-acetylglucosamine 2-epimerase [Arthrobacter globiformis]|uniref:UDP-N-acetylglucosamine 2-epimerase n=1 Tax=Arthrobacter globiformis TaxID=1665 RepID=UPI0027918F98|nr:UDP-N-acetylglucosamine 2-epimerase [Arthrobacter globiformis]MDQ0619536.1 UDP-N-acetylglucosamine 2-epimerase (non-hydrolyzing) [Arthrobacter globiformis]
MRVLGFVGTRADLFPIAPVLVRLAENPDVDLHVATAVGFPAGTATERLREAGLADGAYVHHDLQLYLDDASAAGQLALGPELSGSMADLLQQSQPDAVVVLGDRWELLYVVPPVVVAGVRLVHLHGGEVTEGALDERVRHAVTKLADQHCVSTAGAARRVAQLGESPERIHQTGAPGLDRFSTPDPLTDEEFRSEFGRPLVRPLLMVTYHPPTAEMDGNAGALARQVFDEAIAAGGTAILTYPGFDAGRDEIVAELEGIAAEGAAVVRESLGPLYPKVMATIDALVGNSSSGILEAATFSVPVVNVGDRQKGRECGANVIHCRDERSEIHASIEKALSAEFRELSRQVVNPYGDSHSSARIERVVVSSAQAQLTKAFIDISTGE